MCFGQRDSWAWVYGFASLRAEGRNLKMIDLQINKAPFSRLFHLARALANSSSQALILLAQLLLLAFKRSVITSHSERWLARGRCGASSCHCSELDSKAQNSRPNIPVRPSQPKEHRKISIFLHISGSRSGFSVSACLRVKLILGFASL